jgi:hypothetical protein
LKVGIHILLNIEPKEQIKVTVLAKSQPFSIAGRPFAFC